ncbi:DUF6339 family protein [Ruthenibacterium lactatiformans]|uniref:DUF6339 family protein n=1 Tax=Ruthenibacterium lactatiformans TaxID=1550024 RepID=UPI002431FDE9|nr:DUF6339 family protein [Ruthenibacterium lactatiformans]
MIRYQKLSYNDAKNIVADYDGYNDVEFDDLVKHWKSNDVSASAFDPSYEDFRKELVSVFNDTLAETGGKMNYLLDLRVGIKLYQLMPPGKDFTVIQANDDDIWRYISVKVMPDITYLRYPNPEKGSIRINQKRFYSHTRRIWLKTLWWYIHLSWQGNAEDTFEALKNNGVDNINKLIETPGRGYRIPLFRRMMSEYHKTGPHKVKDFAAFTKLNNAKCVSVEPELTSGGVAEYAQKLLAEVSMQKEIEPNAD